MKTVSVLALYYRFIILFSIKQLLREDEFELAATSEILLFAMVAKPVLNEPFVIKVRLNQHVHSESRC